MKNLPIFEFLIDDSDESGVKCISIVPDPAFQSKAILFSKEKHKFIELSDSKPRKRRVAGLALIPNVLIFRQDEITGEQYYGFFSAETIEKIVEKFHQELNNNNVNLNHNEGQIIDAILIEDYIVDSEARIEDLKSKGITHENIMGSWYVAYKIKNEETFNSIIENQKAGNPTGFSVELFADRFLIEMNNQITNNKIKQEMKKNNKNLLDKIISLFKSETFERILVPELGFEIEWSEVGEPVQRVIVDEEGNETFEPVGAGEFITENGIIVVDESSNLVEIREIPEEMPEEEPEDTLQLPVEDEIPSEAEVNVEIPVEDLPQGEIVEEAIQDSISSLVGDVDGEYYIKVVVNEGNIIEASLSSETDLLKKKINDLKKENEKLSNQLKEPIGEPILQAPVEKKDWNKMTVYEKALYKSKQ